MSPQRGRPPIHGERKAVRLEIRLTETKEKQLEDCASRLGINRSEVIERGIEMVARELEGSDRR